jgi:hypothetical protein
MRIPQLTGAPGGQIGQRGDGAVGIAISCLRWSHRLLALMILAPQVAFGKIAVDGKRARAHQCSSQRPAVRMHPHADVLYPAARVPGCLLLCHLFDGLASALMPATGWRGTRIPLSIDAPVSKSLNEGMEQVVSRYRACAGRAVSWHL